MTSLAIVPAAGRGERFGSAKLTADLRGEPLLAHTVRSLLDGHVARVVVVASETGAFAGIPLLRDPRVTIVVNTDADRGMFSSIQTGLATAEGDPILILPGDMPFIRPQSIATLLESYRTAPGQFIVPRRHARHGHPVLLPGRVRAAALAASAFSTLDALIKGQRLVPIEIEIDDKGILHDVDTPADLMD